MSHGWQVARQQGLLDSRLIRGFSFSIQHIYLNISVFFFCQHIFTVIKIFSLVGAGYSMYRGIRYENKITSLIIVHCFLLLLASCFFSCEFHNWYIHAVFIGKEIHCASEKCSSESPEIIKIMVEDTKWSEKAIFKTRQL